MKQSSKGIIAFVCLMLIYILLAPLGFYGTIGIILFPILSIPLARCLIKNELAMGVDFLFSIVIIIGIYYVTHSMQNVLVYIISVCIPAYTAMILYKKKVPLPNMVMYQSILFSAAVFLYLAVMKQIGVDYEARFILFMDGIKNFYFDTFQMLNQSVPGSSVLQTSIMKEVINLAISIIKQIYPSLILTGIVALTLLQTIILTVLVKRKGERVSSLKQLFNFRLSKVTVLIFAVFTIVSYYSSDMNSIASILSMNILFFLGTLMNVIGIISSIVLLKRAPISAGFKVAGYIVLTVLIISSTTFLMMFGCLDTIFNYRKADIIV